MWTSRQYRSKSLAISLNNVNQFLVNKFSFTFYTYNKDLSLFKYFTSLRRQNSKGKHIDMINPKMQSVFLFYSRFHTFYYRTAKDRALVALIGLMQTILLKDSLKRENKRMHLLNILKYNHMLFKNPWKF